MAVVVPIISEWNPKGVDRAMADIQKAEGKLGKTKAGLEKAFLPATAALAGLGAAAWSAAGAAEELASSQAALGQVLGQMGVGDATERVAALADELERTLGVDEKLIMQVQTSLGTFGELAKDADNAGGAFDRATMAALDLAAAGFGSAEGNAIQLGKALNDPIKGLAALTKSGVTFTDVEKDKIATLVKSGKTLEAQELILAAIEGQVGGTAEATADSSAKMKLGFEDLKETIGMALLPIFDAMNDKLAGFAKWASENTHYILILGGTIGALAGAIVAANIAMKAWAAAQGIIKAATVAWTGVQWALNAAMSANPIGLIVIAIAALIAIVVLAYNKMDWFKDLVDKAWSSIQEAISVVVDWFADTAWPILKKIFEFIAAAVKKYLSIWAAIFTTIWNAMKPVLAWVVDVLWTGIETYFGLIAKAVEIVGNVFTTIFDGIKVAVKSAWDFIRPIIDMITNAINAIKGAWDVVSNIGGAIGGIFGRSAPDNYSVPSRSRSSSSVVNVSVTAGVGDPIRIAREVESIFRARDRRLGVT